MNYSTFTTINHKANHYDVDMSDQDWYDATRASEWGASITSDEAIARIEACAREIAEN